MKKIYSFVLMAAALLIGTNSWAVVVNSASEFETNWPTASFIQLGAKVDLTHTMWLGTEGLEGSGRSVEIDLNGYELTSTATYAFLLTRGTLKISNSRPLMGGQIVGKSSCTNVFYITGSANKDVDPSVVSTVENPVNYFSHLDIGADVVITHEKYDAAISIDQFQKGSFVQKAQSSYVPNKPALTYITNVYADSETSASKGVANGVRLDVHGTINGKKYGIKANGNIGCPTYYFETRPQEGNVIAFSSSLVPAGYVVEESETKYSPFVHIYPEAKVKAQAAIEGNKSPIGVYASGYARWKVEGYVEGCNGALIKSGEVDFSGATVKGIGESYQAATATTSGTTASGSGIAIESSAAYAGDIAVTVSGDSHISSEKGYAIDEAVVTPSGETKVDAITITGGIFEAGDEGTIKITESTASSSAEPVTIIGGTMDNASSNIGDQSLLEYLSDKADEGDVHLTEVIVDGKTTIVISEGAEAPSDDNIAEAAALASIKWTGSAETLTVNKVLTELEISEASAQTLTIDGCELIVGRLILGANAKVIVKDDARLIITGKQGIAAGSVNNIILESSQASQAVLLFNPAVTSGLQPKATVEMSVAHGLIGSENAWTRFGMPLKSLDGLKREHSYTTYIYGWDYLAKGGQGDWALVTSLSDMNAWAGYTLSYDNTGSQKYSFEGNLVGNANADLNFVHRGYNYFGNSFSGYIDAKSLVESLPADIDGTVYMWDANEQAYASVTMNNLINHPEDLDGAWQKDIAPMATFILRLMDLDHSAANVNYASAIWSNPRHGNAGAGAAAPARRAMSNNDAFFKMIVTAANGKSDRINMTEGANYTDAYERGYDAAKFMNQNSINLYATINGENYSDVVTNTLAGKAISLQTANDVNYTISFKNVEGNEYALRDNVTNQVVAIEEGTSYEFNAQPNSIVEGRFEIVPVAEVPTAIENTEVKANVKGIYTITGQFVGEDINALPAGVYVINGVKVVK